MKHGYRALVHEKLTPGTGISRPTRPMSIVTLDSPALEQGSERVLDSAPVTVGRGAQNDLPLEQDEFASARHARFEPRRDGVWIEDIGSTNGSFINGKRVLRGDVRVGDEIGFDTLRFRLVAPGQADTHDEPVVDPTMPSRTKLIISAIAAVAVLVIVAAFVL